MNKTLVYLIYFVVYSVFLLVVGKATSRASDSLDKFFVGERKMASLPPVFYVRRNLAFGGHDSGLHGEYL